MDAPPLRGHGHLEFDLDWRAPIEAMRTQLKSLLAGTELWDERVGILQVTDATNGFVRVRIPVSAADSAALFDLRCLIRKNWLDSCSSTIRRPSRICAGRP